MGGAAVRAAIINKEIVATPHLPDGAFINRVRCYVFDGVDGDPQFKVSLRVIRMLGTPPSDYGDTECGSILSNAPCAGFCSLEIPLPAAAPPPPPGNADTYRLCRFVHEAYGTLEADKTSQIYLQLEAVEDDPRLEAADVVGDFRYCTIDYTY